MEATLEGDMTPIPNPERIQLWVNELETTDRAQGTHYLRRDDSYCCLGIACEVAIANGVNVEVTKANNVYHYDGIVDIMPPEVADWYGLNRNPLIGIEPDGCDCCTGISAIRVNDELGWNFKQIADGLKARHLDGSDG